MMPSWWEWVEAIAVDFVILCGAWKIGELIWCFVS